MHLLRASARHISGSARVGARLARNVNPQLQRQWTASGRRAYASATETVKKASGDMPWLLAAAVVTVPGVYFALQPSASASHGGHDDHADHPTEHQQEDSDQGQEDSAPAEQSDAPSKKDGKEGEDGQDGKEGKEENEGKDEKDDSDSGKSRATKVDGVNFAGGSLKKEGDAKGGVKKRIDSDLAKNIGEGVSSDNDDDMSKKQRGFSNTDTRHSVDISKDSGKSKKGEGTAETAKVKGTVDGNRPQV